MSLDITLVILYVLSGNTTGRSNVKTFRSTRFGPHTLLIASLLTCLIVLVLVNTMGGPVPETDLWFSSC